MYVSTEESDRQRRRTEKQLVNRLHDSGPIASIPSSVAIFPSLHLPPTRAANPLAFSLAAELAAVLLTLLILSRLHRWEQNNVSNRCRIGDQHDDSVDADSQPSRGRQANFQSIDEILIHGMGLIIAAFQL